MPANQGAKPMTKPRKNPDRSAAYARVESDEDLRTALDLALGCSLPSNRRKWPLGLHWKKHVAHALRFLKPRDPEQRFGRGGAGRLVAILPASAWYDGHLDEFGGKWTDLPVASFAESGTNVPTGFFTKWA